MFPIETPALRPSHRGRWLLVTVAAVLVAISVTVRLFVWPAVDHPTRADAVVVLAGGRGERIALGMRLMRERVAPALVLIGEQTEPEAHALCRGGRPPFELVCLPRGPTSTRTEARAAARLASDRQWRTLVLVTSDYHVTRSRMIHDRCFPGDLDVVGAKPPLRFVSLVPLVTKEWAALVHTATVGRDC